MNASLDRKGFTTIELLATVAILGLLASIAILKTGQVRDKAVRASMLVDLRTLVSAEEGFFSANKDYAGGIAGAEVPGLKGRGKAALAASSGNAIKIRYRGTGGWSATATNPQIKTKPKTCGVFMGKLAYAPNAAVSSEGVPACY
jgi:prepilin-type N-terminal cleavage/methylation domain-containing protein